MSLCGSIHFMQMVTGQQLSVHIFYLFFFNLLTGILQIKCAHY
jgi:hypothetical protein